MADLSREFFHAANAADPNVCGSALVDPPFPAGAFVVERPDGLNVRLDTVDGAPPTAAAVDAVLTLDVSPEAIEAREDQAQKEQTVKLFLQDETPTARCVRAIARTFLAWVNEVRMVRLVGFATAEQNLPSIAAGMGLTSPVIPVAGAVIGDGVFVSPPFNTLGMLVYAYVTAPDSVVIRVQNGTNAAIDLPLGVWGVGVFRIHSVAYTEADLAAAVTDAVENE